MSYSDKMTGISRTSASAQSACTSAADELLPERRLQINNGIFSSKAKQRKICVRTASNDPDMRPQTEKLPRTTKFGRLLQRSMSLIHAPSTSKRVEAHHDLSTPGSSNSSSPKDISVPSLSTQSSDTEEDDEITNAFFFSATTEEAKSSSISNKDTDHKELVQKTIVKSVKVTGVHSQKSPHIRYAARKLSLGDFKDLQWSQKRTNLAITNSFNESPTLVRHGCEGNTLDVTQSDVTHNIASTMNEDNNIEEDDATSESEEEEMEFGETLPFTVDSEDLEVAAINSNAPVVPVIAKEKQISPATMNTHTQELAEFLKQSVVDLQALEDLDSIKSDKFNLVNENLSTLDGRLTGEFSTLELDCSWTILGPFSSDDHRETLLHFGARFGLRQFCKHLLTLPGGLESLHMPNQSGLLPADVASNECYDDLEKLLLESNKDYNSSGCESAEIISSPTLQSPDSPDMDYNELESASAKPSAASSLSLDANIDMLHQLMEEMEIDCKNPSRLDTCTHADITDLILPRAISNNHGTTLDSIPESSALHFNVTSGAPSAPVISEHNIELDQVDSSEGTTSVNITTGSEEVAVTTATADSNDSSEGEGGDDSQSSSLIHPSSETSNGSFTDNEEEPPALPPRTWRKPESNSPATLSISPISVGVVDITSSILTVSDGDQSLPGSENVPSITVSPPPTKTPSLLCDSIQLARDSRTAVENMRNNNTGANESVTLKRFSTSCPSLENQALYDGTQGVSSYATAMPNRTSKGQYKSLLDVTQEENEDEVKAAISESPLINRRPNGERPKSLDFSTLGSKLSISGVTGGASTTDFDSDQSFIDRHRKVSFNMFGGAQKEKSKFHQGVTSAGQRSFSLGSLGSEDDEDEQRTRLRERSADSDGHVKPIDIYGAPLQKLPNVDFSKHMGQQSDGSTSSLQSTSQEQLHRPISASPAVMRHSTLTRSALPLPQSHGGSNLNKSISVSTPSINQIGEQGSTNRHSGLYQTQQTKSHNTDSLRRTGPRRPLSQEQESSSAGPSNYDDEDKKSKKAGRRTSVFAKFGSGRKTGKTKDKNEREIKRANHNFIPVTLANSTCNYCSKLLNYKASVQCSNCLMNYHDECKDRVLSCPKQRTRERKSPVVQPLSSLTGRHEIGDGIMSPSIGDSYSPSMESLVDDGNADDEYEDDPELIVKGLESESWSETIDKKVLKNQKAKYIQRQDNIWELIATERQYCVNLKIMQRVFATGMKNECTLPETVINRIFPELDELLDLHQAFLSSLQDRQDKKPDKSVDHIGDVIIQHFGGPTGERMKRAYGIFCSRHKEGIDYYKHLYKVDRKFQTFIKKVSNKACTKRRGVQDLVTVVTMRMTKYRTLIENIIKNTKESKDKQDKENLNKALDLNKEILHHINTSIHNRNQELRLLEIYNRMDARSTASYDKIKKFKKSDLTAKSRKLRHEGVLSWRNAREKEVEMLVVVLSDVILFLQENDKKYSFFTQDNKASVIPLSNLIVREKGSTKDNRGIYLIRQSREHPEMYELVCKSSQERRDWIDLLRKAVDESPEEDEGVINETEEEHREVIAKLGKLREYVESLDYKDKELERFCRERFSIIADIMQVYDYADVLQNIKSCYDEDGELRSASELIRLSIDEASLLASLYQTVPPITNLGRSWSSVGERQSPTYQQVPLPKRAETFNGFDQDQVKSPAATTRSILDRSDLEGRSPSLLNLQHDSDCEGNMDITTKVETSRNISVNRRSSSNILQQFLATSSSTRQEETDSGNDSLLAMSNMLAITAIIPPTQEQAQCATQLNEYLHGVLIVTNRQESRLEHVKHQLADERVRSRKIEQEQEKKSLLRHNKQMEEIRNRHEQLTKEREILESEKESLNEKLRMEQLEMEEMRKEMGTQQEDLKKEREELQRQKEALQKQIDFYMMKGNPTGEPAANSPSLSPHGTPLGSNTDLHTSSSSSTENTKSAEVEISHRRSHSAELIDFVDSQQQMFVDPRYSASLTEPLNIREVRAQQLGHTSVSPDRQSQTNSSGSLSKADGSSSQSSLKRISSNNNTVQQIPSKLAMSSTNKTSTSSSNRHSKSMLPLNLAESSKKVSGSKEQTAKTPGHSKKGDVIYF